MRRFFAALTAGALAVAGTTAAPGPPPAGAAHDDVADACPSARTPEDGFGDVAAGSVHEPSVDCLVWWGVTGGTTWATYQPASGVTRAQMASFVARLVERVGATLPAQPTDHFDDDDGSVHEPRINQLAELGVISGTGPRTFAPGDPVTRGQTAALLVRGYEEATGGELPAATDHFDDDDGTEHEAAIDAAAQTGWAKGVAPRRFAPGQSLRRDEMATFVVRVLDTGVEDGEASLPASFATSPPPALDLQPVTTAAQDPIQVTAPPGDDRLFVVERAGRVRILDGGALTTWLDISAEVSTGGEGGLLGIAFPPRWPDDGRVFVSWTDRSGDSHLEAFEATPADAVETSRAVVDFVEQPASNHNGGMVTFGPDGLLWWGLGDGGGSNDQYGNGQNGATPLGGLNRYDVHGDPQARPAGNVFGERSLWAIGLRNPWRFSFDAATGHLYVADVGQGSWEEVSVVPGRRTGLNHGWPIMEGTHCMRAGCDPSRYVVPVHEYANGAGGCSVTGGVVYRGTDIPALRGHYLFSDYCAGFLRSFRFDGQRALDVVDHPAAASRLPGDRKQVVSLGTDDRGEVYVVAFSGIHRIVAAG